MVRLVRRLTRSLPIAPARLPRSFVPHLFPFVVRLAQTKTDRRSAANFAGDRGFRRRRPFHQSCAEKTESARPPVVRPPPPHETVESDHPRSPLRVRLPPAASCKTGSRSPAAGVRLKKRVLSATSTFSPSFGTSATVRSSAAVNHEIFFVASPARRRGGCRGRRLLPKIRQLLPAFERFQRSVLAIP